jgi:hypothetical protein
MALNQMPEARGHPPIVHHGAQHANRLPTRRWRGRPASGGASPAQDVRPADLGC